VEIVVLATADWDNPLWTNKQHLTRRWGRMGHRVLYIESLGLRRPELAVGDLSRIWHRLLRANRLRGVAPGVWTLSPLQMPAHELGFVRRANRWWLERLVRGALDVLEFTEPTLVTYNPLAVDYLDRIPWKHVVYHCVDELTGAPGIPGQLLEERERALLRRAELVVVSARSLAAPRRQHARRVEYLPNAADFDHFSGARSDATEVPADLSDIRKPRVGFVGAVSDYKLDLQLLAAVFSARPDWQLVLIGPVGEGQPGTRVSELQRLDNVHVLGPRSYEFIPAYIKGFDVCLLPNRLTRYTLHMFPLKFFEYLATGKPVVMSPLPALEEYWHLGYVAQRLEPKDFIAAIDEALSEPGEAAVRSERIAQARRHDWDRNAQELIRWIRELDSPDETG